MNMFIHDFIVGIMAIGVYELLNLIVRKYLK